jgi:hypothetical protein
MLLASAGEVIDRMTASGPSRHLLRCTKPVGSMSTAPDMNLLGSNIPARPGYSL